MIENIPNVSSDSIQIHRTKIMLQTQKYSSDLEDAFMKVINYLQLYEMNNKIDKNQPKVT